MGHAKMLASILIASWCDTWRRNIAVYVHGQSRMIASFLRMVMGLYIMSPVIIAVWSKDIVGNALMVSILASLASSPAAGESLAVYDSSK
jgi:hypothetical protein